MGGGKGGRKHHATLFPPGTCTQLNLKHPVSDNPYTLASGGISCTSLPSLKRTDSVSEATAGFFHAVHSIITLQFQPRHHIADAWGNPPLRPGIKGVYCNGCTGGSLHRHPAGGVCLPEFATVRGQAVHGIILPCSKAACSVQLQ